MEKDSLLSFITRRLAELKREEEPLLARLAQIKLEREQLRKASLAAGIESHEQTQQLRDVSKRPPRRLATKTLKEAIVEILSEKQNGLSAAEILHDLNSRHNASFARASLSPQISRLRQEGRIELTGHIWHLKGKPPKEGDRSSSDIVPKTLNLEERKQE
jgi:hypothetical protein